MASARLKPACASAETVTFDDRPRPAELDDLALPATVGPELAKALPPMTTLTATVISLEGLLLQYAVTWVPSFLKYPRTLGIGPPFREEPQLKHLRRWPRGKNVRLAVPGQCQSAPRISATGRRQAARIGNAVSNATITKVPGTTASSSPYGVEAAPDAPPTVRAAA